MVAVAVHGVVLSHAAGAAAAVAALSDRNAGFPVTHRQSVAGRSAHNECGALMSINATAKAACAASPAANSDPSRKKELLTAAWLMARRWKGRIFFAVL